MISAFSLILGFGIIADKAKELVDALFKGIYESIIKPFADLHSLKTLIFNDYKDGERVYGTFTADEITNAIAPGVQSMSYIVGFFLVLGIIFMGVKISNTGLNPSNRTVFLEFVRDWVIVVLVLANIGFVYEMIFMFNEAIVGIVHGEVIEALDDELMPDLVDDVGLIGWIIIGLFMLGVTIWANFYYIMREITLMVLMILGPVFLALYIFPTTKGVSFAWLKEFFGTVMIQSVHAVTLFTVAIIADGGEAQVLEMTIMYLIIIPTGEAIKGLLNLGGDMTGRLGKFATMSGAAGIAGIYGAVKSATTGEGFAKALRNGYEGAKGKRGEGENGDGTSGAVAGAVAGTDTRASRMLKAGDIVSKSGKMLVGAAGATAGSVMGPQGAMVGGFVGTGLGGAVGGLAGRAGFAAGDKMKDALSRTKNGVSQGLESAVNEQDADKYADSLAGVQTDEWAKENYDSFKKDAESKNGGPLPEQELNKMWSSRLGEKRKQFKADNKAALLNGDVNPNYARATDLAEQMAQEKLNESLQKSGRDDFVKRLPEGTSQEDMDKAWGAEKDRRLDKYRQQANGIANQLTGNKPKDSFVSKDDFAKAYESQEMAKFDANEKGFKTRFQKQNPNATAADVDNAWNEARSQAQSRVGNSAKRISENTKSASPVSLRPNDRKSADLVTSAAEQMTNDWAKANEKGFKDKIRQSGEQKIEQEVETEWNTRVQQVQSENRKQAQVDTQNWAKANEQGMKEQLLKDNPNLSPEQLDNTFNTLVQGKAQENMKQADAKTNSWAQANQQPVKAEMKQAKQQALESHVNDRFKEAYKQQYNSHANFAGEVAQEVSGGQSLAAYVDKGQFAQALTNQRIKQAQPNFMKQNSHLQGADLDKAWKAEQTAIEANSSDIANNVQARTLSKGYSTRSALATDFATKATNAWANNPSNQQSFEQQFTKDFDAVPENAALKQSNPSAYKRNLGQEKDKRWNQEVQAQFNGNMSKAEDALLVDSSTNGVVLPTSMGNVLSGAKGFKKGFNEGSGYSVRGSAPIQYAKGFKNSSGKLSERHNGGIKQVYDQQHPDATTEEKAKAYRDNVSYRQGVLRGVGGYQKTAQKAMDKNPYAKEMYNSAHEVADIARMAKTETIELPNGQTQTRVAQGAVKLVVERDRSYLQVETKDGQMKTVSQYGAGDSSLAEGTVLFKDYNVEDQALVPSTSSKNPNSNGFYAKDTAGHKVMLNRKVNMDANSILQTRRQIQNQETEPMHDAYNFKVDSGQFDANDIKTHSADRKAVLVVEKNRSYVAMNGEDNKMYRVSPIQDVGNSNLNQGEVVYKEYVVEGGQLRERSLNNEVQLKTYTRNTNGQEVAVDSSRVPDSININEMIQPPQNRRFNRRQEVEKRRTKSGAYL